MVNFSISKKYKFCILNFQFNQNKFKNNLFLKDLFLNFIEEIHKINDVICYFLTYFFKTKKLKRNLQL